MTTYGTEFSAINRAVQLSEREFLNEIVIVYQRTNGDFGVTVEAEYTGLDENVRGKYLNGHLAPA